MEQQVKTINTQNPDHITYQYHPLQLAVLGGIRLDGLDRLRTTLKIEHHHKALRHNLDLYNDTQVEKLTRRAAEKLEIGTTFISKALAELTSHLEKYRLEEITKQKTKEDTRKPLTAEQIKEAQDFLRKPFLMQRTNEMIGKAGVIGEERNRLLMYVIFTSRKREHPLHIISLGSSGTGKTHLQEKVSELIPQEDKIEITSLTDNAFYYFGQRELQNKLILIEDLDGAEGVLYPLRELQSKKRISKTVVIKDARGNTKTIHLTVEGPVSVAGCTTQESVYEDNANRSFLIYLDESKEQDERIMQHQRTQSAGKIDNAQQRKIQTLLQHTQKILQPITIRNPYAEQLQLPAEVFKPRRTNAHYLAFIEAITFYHQYQREQKTDESTGEIYIETTVEDITEAGKLMKEILLHKSDELTGACRGYFEKLKAWLQQKQETTFTNKEIRDTLRIPASTVKRHNLELLNSNYLKIQEDKKAKGYRYEVVSYEEYKALKTRISTVIDEIIKRLSASDQPNGSQVAQLKNEPPKQKKTSKIKQSAQQPAEESKHKEKNTAQ